jgi:tRNA-Thr(GGU) m(6)t(6)A37 methyltransferase TsaA
MKEMRMGPIGRIAKRGEESRVELEGRYAAGLTGLEGYSHVLVLWWADRCDDAAGRGTLVEKKPYRTGPEEVGVFACRSPRRPNPIAVSVARVVWLDARKGEVGLDFIDAADGTPVVDVKPYVTGADRAESARVPDWCAHWPKSREESGAFDWAAEFLFAEADDGAR